MAQITPIPTLTKSGRPVLIRTQRPDDAAAILELNRHVRTTATEFSVTLPEESTTTPEQQAAEIAQALDHPRRLLLCAEHDGRFVGEVAFLGVDRKRLHHNGRLSIGIHADYRDDGLGRALIAPVLDWARHHPDIEEVWLGVFAHNARAIALYTKLGFVEQWRQPRFLKLAPGVYADDVAMLCRVKPAPTS